MSARSVKISSFRENLGQAMERLSHHYTPDKADYWLRNEHPKLGWNKPMDFLEDRMPEVLELIDQLNRESKIVDPLNGICEEITHEENVFRGLMPNA